MYNFIQGRIMRKLLCLSLTILLANSAFAAKDAVVAKVNGVEIKQSELLQAYNQNLLYVSDKVVTKEKVLNDLINRILGVQRAKKAKLQNNAVVKKKMEDILYHAQVSKDLEQRLNKIVVTDKDVQEYYKKFPEYRTAHILLRVKVQPTKEEWEGALKKALEINEALKMKPEKFSELANKFSTGTTASVGGDLGFRPAINLAPEYFKAINGKKDGYITTPIRTQFGYHIIKVIAKKDFKSINQGLYKKIVYDKKRDAILDQYFSELRKSAKVSIDKKFLK